MMKSTSLSPTTMKKRNLKIALCAAIRSREPEKERYFYFNTCTCVLGNVSKDITLSKSFSVGPIVYRDFVCVYRRVK
jgi:hypothetical protein